MSKNTFRTPGASISLAEAIVPAETTTVKDMQLLKTGKFYDPRYKWFEVTDKLLSEMISNFKAGIRGIIPALDYMHESEGAAAGWIKDLFIKKEAGVSQLWGKIELTPRAQKVLSDKEFGYLSADFDENYLDNETGKKHGAVLLGAALTNRPVIKKMDAVIQLAEKSSDAVSEKIKKLISEGYDQDQAVAIALEMDQAGKLSEKGESKMNEEMQKKMADMEKKCAESDKKLADLKQIMDDNGIADMEALMKMIAEMKAKGAPAPASIEVEKELADAKKELSESKAMIETFKKKAENAEKEIDFTKLLSEGKAVAAQREAFLENDMKKFIELSQPIKLSEQGSAVIPKSKEDSDDVEAEIESAAKKLSEEKKISFGEAVSEVLESDKSLSERRKKKFESDSE